jgi:hypothetical protein
MPSAPTAVDPRLDRDQEIPTNAQQSFASVGTPGGGYPNVRLWSFGFHRTAQAFKVVWSPGFKGPAIVKDIVLFVKQASLPGIRIDVARSRGVNTGGAGNGDVFGEPLWEQPPAIGEDVSVYDSLHAGLQMAGNGNLTALQLVCPIGRIIRYDQFFLALVNIAGDLVSAAQASGYVRVVEGDTEESLRPFL